MAYINKDLYEDIASSSNVVRGNDYRELVCAISQVASDMVVKTLGPYGRTTVIDEGTGFTYPSKDGWSCLNKLQFTDPTYNSIYQMLKKISFNSVSTVGDGTTTAMVAANNFLQIMYEKFIPEMDQRDGFRQASFIESMEKIYVAIEKKLRESPYVKHIDVDGDFSDIYKIANIATNGNEKFSNIIKEIYVQTKNPNIQVELAPNEPETTYTIQNGYKFASRVLDHHGYVNDHSGSIIYKNTPKIVVIFDHNVNYQTHEKIIGALAGICQRDNKEVIIMAPYFDDILASWMAGQVNRCVQNHQVPSMMLMQIPMATQLQRKTLSDLCVLTNAQIFDEPKVKAFNILYHNQTHNDNQQINDPMMSLEEYTYGGPEEVVTSCMGLISSIIIDKNESFLQDYDSIMNKTLYETIINEAKEDYYERKRKAIKTIGGTLDKDFMFSQMRYIKLTGSTGVIKVGAPSDIQQRTDKDTIDDAVLACRSAFENGYVRGMNLEILTLLYHLIHKTESLDLEKLEYEENIYEMLYKCFFDTSMMVIFNKHHSDKYRKIDVEGHQELILRSEDALIKCIQDPRRFDYNLRTETLSPDGSWEVINSTATDIEILRAVVNVLTTIITSDQYISVTKRFDVTTTNERTIRRRLAEDYRIIQNKTNAFMDTLSTNENYDLLQGLIGGVCINGEVDELSSFDEPLENK